MTTCTICQYYKPCDGIKFIGICKKVPPNFDTGEEYGHIYNTKKPICKGKWFLEKR